jgi:hypothetical protein
MCTLDDRADGAGQCIGDPRDCDDQNSCTDDDCDPRGGGFLCTHDNNGSCTGANCGNGVIDAGDGETCDPPDATPDPQTGQVTCRPDCTSCGDGVVQANNTETCDDGNPVSGCRPDHVQTPLDACLNNCTQPICKDPASIKFKRIVDLITFRGVLITASPVDFAGQDFVFELRTTTGDVIPFRVSLNPHLMDNTRPGVFKYRDVDAKVFGGLFKLKIARHLETYKLTLKAYGHIEGAVSDMTSRVYSGSQQWAARGLWQQRTQGWKLKISDTFHPVP